MSMTPTYQAANIAAPLVEEHFARHLAEARRMGEDDLAPQPDAQSIASIINATFWASFRPEEGRFPKISIAYLPVSARAIGAGIRFGSAEMLTRKSM